MMRRFKKFSRKHGFTKHDWYVFARDVLWYLAMSFIFFLFIALIIGIGVVSQ